MVNDVLERVKKLKFIIGFIVLAICSSGTALNPIPIVPIPKQIYLKEFLN